MWPESVSPASNAHPVSKEVLAKPSPMHNSVFSSVQATIYALLLTISCAAHAQTYTVLHTFKGAPTDGEAPFGVLNRDSTGNLYGASVEGGSGKCNTHGCGAAFMLNKTGSEVWLHSFGGKNGEYPSGGLFRDSAGNLYGTTEDGGTNCYGMGFPGCGTVFKLNKVGSESQYYSFAGTPNGYSPSSLLVESSGNLYGTALGGTDGLGVVFSINRTGNETVLHSFTGSSDGCSPAQGVIPDAAGNLYGVTFSGGSGFCNSGYGTVYKLDTNGVLIVLHTFAGSDGGNPNSRLIFDAQGNLYGTTANGGNAECGGTGCGTVFELSPQPDGNWSQTVLYDFCSLPGCADGQEPEVGPLAVDSAGNIYGTTYFGGAYRNCNGDACGVVFKLDTTRKETVLHSFTGGADGAFPTAGLAIDNSGNLYGTAEEGGDTTCYPPYGCGTVFELTP